MLVENLMQEALIDRFSKYCTVRTSWLLVISHTLLMPNGKGSSNSSVYLKQTDWSYTLPVTRKLCIDFQYRNRAASNAKIQ